MNRIGIILLTVVVLFVSFGTALAETKVLRIAAAEEIVDREPVKVNNIFKSDVEKIYCFTEIQTDQFPTTITHVWLHEGETMAEVPLNVGAGRWRTYSSKRMVPGWTGHWRVEVHAEDGTLLDATEFVVLE